MSLEEIELMKEAHVRNHAVDTSRQFDSLIAFLFTALPDNDKAFQVGKTKADQIRKFQQQRSVAGLKRIG